MTLHNTAELYMAWGKEEKAREIQEEIMKRLEEDKDEQGMNEHA
eukprot:CAMPEP_0196787754 /NCGR_PEP_ID=MMETSP1104-20130614/23666_1 /TAXON_ID=33652 /ORGANISM="Cafeteria sp., Strain Caron Lab Isolate" /LENGTH=43 /DNA_ID= /DNA_START= /DNA_END= /DNA_ORIENTATION=